MDPCLICTVIALTLNICVFVAHHSFYYLIYSQYVDIIFASQAFMKILYLKMHFMVSAAMLILKLKMN